MEPGTRRGPGRVVDINVILGERFDRICAQIPALELAPDMAESLALQLAQLRTSLGAAT